MLDKVFGLPDDIVSISSCPISPNLFLVATAKNIRLYDSIGMITAAVYIPPYPEVIVTAKFHQNGLEILVALFNKTRILNQYTLELIDVTTLKHKVHFSTSEPVNFFVTHRTFPQWVYGAEENSVGIYDIRRGAVTVYKHKVVDIALFDYNRRLTSIMADPNGGMFIYEDRRISKSFNFYQKINAIALPKDSFNSILNPAFRTIFAAGDMISSYTRGRSIFVRPEPHRYEQSDFTNAYEIPRHKTYSWANCATFYDSYRLEPKEGNELMTRVWHYWNDKLKRFSMPHHTRNNFFFHARWTSSLDENPPSIRCLKFSPFNDALYAAGDGGMVKEYSCDKHGILNFTRVLAQCSKDIHQMDISSDGSYLIYTSDERTVENVRLFRSINPCESFELA